ncbi:NodT family efflux transporter outer membrane factor (OMF) lipoprotein [Luteibacter sp. Sphag1AF]|uniref:efflux transporter outer membrane subunit n=1 Tax=Luteibacter sp. Sphag1AF TaxID=2587031 RepID=UPI00161F32CA|nr:efflux transporter outer membrane subunit [Luteibacter sp. Sphag1AF]MBB3228223.1 NodT family efflux transporter outer membrane factor (OMF) lipoprotein [Luteibacter sp. Sphag1AF]
MRVNPFVRFLSLVASVSLFGCTLGPDFVRPAVTPPVDTFASAAGLPSARVGDDVTADWWDMFGDPLLSSLEHRAYSQNLDLQMAVARVAQGRARLTVAGADGLPRISAGASKLRERSSPNGIMKLSGTASTPDANAASGNDPFGTASMPGKSGSAPFDVWQAGMDASWELDLWGRARRSKEAARASYQANQYDVEAARVSLAAEIARTYLTMRGVQSLLEVTRQNRDVAAHTLVLAKSREAHGVSTRFDAASAAAQLASIEATLPALDAQLAEQMNALALLLGQAPGSLNDELRAEHDIPAPPARVPVGLPSTLAHRRPDILAAEANLHAATAAIGMAEADFYPSLTLTGSFGFQSLNFSGADQWGSRQFALGPVMNIPLFQGGRLKGTLALTKAHQQEAAVVFQLTVLRAWHEVDDAMTRFDTTQRQEAYLREAVTQSRVAYNTAQRRYQEGAADYLTVLVAQRDLLNNQRALTQGSVDMALSMVGLYKSLGGGWESPASTQAAL